MRQRPRRFEALHAAVDARGLEDADEDRKRAAAVDLLEIDHLLIVDLADDDPGQFHRDGHGAILVLWQCSPIVDHMHYSQGVLTSGYNSGAWRFSEATAIAYNDRVSSLGQLNHGRATIVIPLIVVICSWYFTRP